MPRRLHKIIWSEGMYLAPHHFQSQARFFEESIQFTRDCFWPYGHGFLDLQLDENELNQGCFALHHMRGVMPDGVAFEISIRADLPERRIEALFPPTGGTLTLFLALPKHREKERNVDRTPPEQSEKSRYRPAEVEVGDMNTGLDRETVGVLKQNFRIATSDEVVPDDTAMPIARIMRDGMGRYVPDPEFVPPCLRVSTNPRLKTLLSEVLDFLTANSRALSGRRRASAQRSEARSDPKALAEFWLLHTINSAIPVLQHWETGSSPRPADAFRCLAQLAGVLCTFAPDGDPQRIPEYAHDSLGECFIGVVELIRRYATPSVADSSITIPLEPLHVAGTPSDASFVGAEIRDLRCYDERSQWILAISARVPDARLTSQVPDLVLVSSRKYINRVVSEGRGGLPLTHLPNPPAGCPNRFGRKYFSIETQDDRFELIRKDQTIGVYIPSLLRQPELELHILLGEASR